MSIVSETYRVDLSQADFVHVERSAVVDTAAGMHTQKSSLRFERGNLPWVIEALRTCLTTYGIGEQAHAGGRDSITVYEAGSEAQPTFNIDNERPDDAPHSGTYWIGMSRELAESLLCELETIE